MSEKLMQRASEVARVEPHTEERQRYLAHLIAEGRSASTLQHITRLLLAIAHRLDISDGKILTRAEVDTAAEDWLTSPPRSYRRRNGRLIAKSYFVFRAIRWLCFLGRFDQQQPQRPFASNLDDYEQFMTRERGLAPETISMYTQRLRAFFEWFSLQGRSLAEITPQDISAYLQSDVARSWKRTTISIHVNALRGFLRYAENRDWCTPGLAGTIDAPRLYTHERLPRGPEWREVQELLASVEGDDAASIRNRAMLLLHAIYGFRSSDVRRLCLENLDWENETIHLFRSKQRKTQHYPLVKEVGEAILRYLRKVRPRSSRREVFLTLVQPFRPLSDEGLAAMVRLRQKKLGLSLPRYGPHALRHACATHLLAEGFSLKEIGDHLGHVSPLATQIYAKVNLPALQEVADFDLSRLADCLQRSARSATPIFARGGLSALRAVAQLSLGGLL